MSGTATSDRIPIVSVAALFQDNADDEQQRALAERLCAICHDIGFVIVVDHNVSTELTRRTFEMMREFFALPREQKALIDKQRSRHFRGWEPLGTERTNGRVDVREQIDVWTEMEALGPTVLPEYRRLIGPNMWLPEEVLSGHRETTLEWTDALGVLASRLLGSLWTGLGLDEGHRQQAFGADAMSHTKFISYPSTPGGAAGVNAHKDTGFLTVLCAGTTPGLQVMDHTGEWLDVPVVPGSFVINVGEMLQATTGGYLVATPHRVITSEPRLSSAYFYGPSLDTSLNPLPLRPELSAAVAASERHAAPGFMATQEQITAGVSDMGSAHHAAVFGEQLWNYLVRSYPAIIAQHYNESKM
jgi:isopenicillin N synthase-like dioxygenase